MTRRNHFDMRGNLRICNTGPHPQEIVRVQQTPRPVRQTLTSAITTKFPLSILQSGVPEELKINKSNLKDDTFTAENFVPFTVIMLIGTLCAAASDKY